MLPRIPALTVFKYFPEMLSKKQEKEKKKKYTFLW